MIGQFYKVGFGALLCLLVTAFVMVDNADAQSARYRRTTKINVKVKQSDRTKKMEPKEKKAEARPEISADDFISIQSKVTHIRKAQITTLVLLIEETDNDDPELPDLYFRLGEMYAQQQRYWRFRAMDLYTAIDKAKGAEKAGLERKQKGYFDASTKELKSAIKQYKKLFDNDNFRNFPRMDEALFYYAYTLQSAKYLKEARKVFQRLIQDHPDSKYVPDAYLSFAEYYFEQNSMANAERFYKKVLQFPKASVYTYALYKKGWVFLNLDKNQAALEVFFDVVKRTQNDKSKTSINRAAKKDFVRAYAEIGKPETALQAFRRVDKSYAFTMLQFLGDIYLEQGKAQKSIYVYRELLKEDPKHKLACEWQYNVVHAMLSVGTKEQKVREISNLVKLYAHYRDKKVLPDSNLAECADNAEAVNNEMAKIWHNEAMKTLNTEDLQYVETLYKLYIDSFTESEELGDMQYYYAELLWQRADAEKNQRKATDMWEKTAVAFTDVVKAGKTDEKKRKEAAYAAVLGWKNALKVDPRTKAQAPTEANEGKGEVPEPKDIPEREQKMIAAFDVYIDYIKDPKDEELVMMKFLKARTYWRYNQFEQAIPLFEDILKKHESHETAEYAANLLLDTLNRTKQYKEMIAWVDILMNRKAFLEDKEDMAARLELLKRQSLRLAAQELENSGKFVDCGAAYLDIFNRDPEGEDMDEVLYNSGVCFEKAKSIGAAKTVFEILAKRFPDSKTAQKSIARLGRNYARIAWYDEAASRFEEYAKRFGGEEDAYEALSDAVFYRKGIGDDEKAIANTEDFVKKYQRKRPKQAATADYSITAIYEKQGDKDKVVQHLRDYLKTHRKHGGIDRELIAHVKIGQILWERSCPVKGVMGACIKVTRQRSSLRKSSKKKRAQLPTQCGPESKIKVAVVKRDRRMADSARGEFKKAVTLFKKGALKKVPGDESEKAARSAAMMKYYAAAEFTLIDQDYEEFLGVTFPKNMDFDPRNKKKKEKSLKIFKAWVTKKAGLAEGLKADFLRVVNVTGGGAHYPIAAAARAGQVFQNFSDALFTASIPENVRTGKYAIEKVDAYCDELTNKANPLEEESLKAYGFCLGTSTKLSWFSEWSQLCERELGQIRPQEFPTASEIHAVANNLAPITATQGPELELAN